MAQQSFLLNTLHGAANYLRKAWHNPYSQVNLSRAKVKILKHQRAGNLYQHQMLGSTFYFRHPQNFLDGIREIFVEQCYRQELPPAPYIIDCGANIGLSVLYLKQLFPDATIDAFEPDAQNFELLQQNVKSYQLQQVQLHQAAIWTTDGKLNFYTDGTMGSSIAGGDQKKTVAVEAVRLKNMLNKPVDFLKMDIEGAEYQVLVDVASELHHVRHLFVEYHGMYANNDELIELLRLIRQQGFQVYIEDAAKIYQSPFLAQKTGNWHFDIQLNIFCKK